MRGGGDIDLDELAKGPWSPEEVRRDIYGWSV